MAIRRLLLLAGFICGLAVATAEPHALTMEDLWAVKRVGPPSLSPDGRWAVVEVTTPDMNENDSPMSRRSPTLCWPQASSIRTASPRSVPASVAQ